ncbi:Sodium- and chloride-dependent GABA transporter 2,Sodium- and chloride-dependent taurine transporter,Sodium-dependent noradrenaline transporter,Sodium- and chloride-dependent betaine transporter,Sodium- and chloride-dependent neutral and basic amino acid transporter B(0+),Sodium- and chloride-dependent creatine transporter 1,Sodium- and chloride-dependent glycine transporter 1 [Mytilus edulis]|uniref:Transporter n=1 Tax=Mytilus edulis TaxID=6550 RepID=A0A8S3QY11_MYTED|nr:Sodium- and chloride-dependent GABA transporter 2,Sodium- and chloride-dependent taurine transporter,Sodium-dependent noradrenaline transporter,Sodium- and chloride-dependent betaine transporter,Sodium- and chloride-dependent neutral and basic amino acid transporter B(0+),Sodium- and chloride-dependent creatine transporter 1,Sodium- and chloride-dependent glycine transporter 1 [Mytilus edulis]
MSSSNISPVTEDEIPARGQWGRKIEYFLSMVGFTVGLGNLWRFPYICLRNGGGAFLIPYFICLLLFGIPLFFLETAAGQFSGQGLMHVWEVCPIFKGVGICMVIVNVLCAIYYNIILAWTIYYIGNAFIVPLPWTTCDNTWNSQQCVADRGVLNQGKNFTTQNHNLTIKMFNIDVDNTTTSNEYTWTNDTSKEYTWTNDTSKLMTAQEEFWQYNVLRMSSGIHDIGDLNWRLALCLFGAWLLICVCLSKGVKSVGKVVYVTATLPYILLTIVLVKGLTLDGAIDGVIVYLKPDFSKLLKLQVWMEASIQVFYSLGATWGPGLGFIIYPEALGQLPGQNIWSALFFVMLLIVGLDSQFGFVEVVIVACTDNFHWLRSRRVKFVIVVCFANFLCGMIMTTEGGIYIFQVIDWYIAAFIPAVFGIIECIVFGWIYGIDRFSRDVKLMLGRGIPIFFRICICFITPSILLAVLVYSITAYQPPTYGSYQYPDAAVGFGICVSVFPLISIIVCAFIVVLNMPGDTYKQKITAAFRPSSKWKPAIKEIQSDYYENGTVKQMRFFEKVKLNLIGEKNKLKE